MARPQWHDEHQRLKVALSKTRTAFESDSSGLDYDIGTDIANRWIYIASCYSGVEQSLKVIDAAHRGRSIAEIRKDVPYGRGHDLALLFESLDHEAKCILMRYYSRFQSLHNYIPIDSLSEFLQSISRTDGKGYERWRYALIETDSELPTNSAEAMLAIWASSVQLIGARVGVDHVTMPEQALTRKLRKLLLRVPPDTDTIEPVWKECYFGPISHAARLLWKEHRGIEVKLPCMRSWVKAIKEESNKSKELTYFIARATGNTESGLGILWDSDSNRFVAIPWNMEAVVENSAPVGARELYSSVWDTRPDVLHRVYRNGYTVRENWECGNRLDGRWWRTIVAEKIDASGTQGVLTAWRHDYDLFVTLDGSAVQLFQAWEFK